MAEIGGPWPLLDLRTLHKIVIYAIENYFSLAKWPPLLSIASSASESYCLHQILKITQSCTVFYEWRAPQLLRNVHNYKTIKWTIKWTIKCWNDHSVIACKLTLYCTATDKDKNKTDTVNMSTGIDNFRYHSWLTGVRSWISKLVESCFPLSGSTVCRSLVG